MTRKRQGMYLSTTDDAKLVQELDRCTVRGRKADLLRNYALLGYQRALELCAKSRAAEDQSALTRALAELFAPDDAPPDFRSASEFIKTQMAGRAAAVEQEVIAVGPPVSVKKEALESISPEKTDEIKTEEEKTKPTHRQWGGLSSLVGGSSKDRGVGNAE